MTTSAIYQSASGSIGWQEKLATFWQAVERDMAVQKIFTESREPTFEEGYTEFLGRLGYASDADFERWWSKERSVKS